MAAATERHHNLALALPRCERGPIVDLGCGRGATLVALRERLGTRVELVGVDKAMPPMLDPLAADEKVRRVAADLKRRLPFEEATFEAAVCHNTLECLPDRQAFLRDVERVLTPGGHLLLGHTDFDTMVFSSSDLELTRRLVHANADTQEAWMDASDGTIGRKLIGIARQSPFELAGVLAWVVVDTDLEEGSAAASAVRSIAGAIRRDGDAGLAARLDDWVADLRALARRGEFLHSVNDYAVLLRKRV